MNAVDNMARLVKETQDMLLPADQATLHFGLFLLKMQPQYTGLEPRKDSIE